MFMFLLCFVIIVFCYSLFGFAFIAVVRPLSFA